MKSSFYVNALFFFGFVSSATAAVPNTLNTRIHDVLRPETAGERFRVLSSADGRVYDVATSQALMARLEEASALATPVTLVIEGDRVVGANELSAEAKAAYTDALALNEQAVAESEGAEAKAFLDAITDVPNGNGYAASNLASMDDAQDLFDNLRDLDSRSQCYQRAHYWARQMSSRGVSSMKVFLFFTRKFIRERRFKWWFHVAPYVYVQGQEIVLDPEFVETPLTMPKWTDNYMMSEYLVHPPLQHRPECAPVPTYSAFEDHQEEALCYTLRVPMYYYQPIDAEKLEKENAIIQNFRSWDVGHSERATRCRLFRC